MINKNMNQDISTEQVLQHIQDNLIHFETNEETLSENQELHNMYISVSDTIRAYKHDLVNKLSKVERLLDKPNLTEEQIETCKAIKFACPKILDLK